MFGGLGTGAGAGSLFGPASPAAAADDPYNIPIDLNKLKNPYKPVKSYEEKTGVKFIFWPFAVDQKRFKDYGLKKEYDLAITSPPYYNLELYSDETTQSHHYGSYEDWIDKFLKPVVHGVLDKLVEGGKSCWSVKNFKTDKAANVVVWGKNL